MSANDENISMSMVEYARHRGITKQAVSKLVKEDRLFLTEDGRINVGISDALLDASPRTVKPGETDPQKGQQKRRATKKGKKKVRVRGIDSLSAKEKAGLKSALGYPEARARLTKYKAALAKLELEEQKGKLVRTSKIKKEAFECARRTRNKVLSVVDRVSGIIAAESDEMKIKETLDKELRQALEELSIVTANIKEGNINAKSTESDESGNADNESEPTIISLGEKQARKNRGKGAVRVDNGRANEKNIRTRKAATKTKTANGKTIKKDK